MCVGEIQGLSEGCLSWKWFRHVEGGDAGLHLEKDDSFGDVERRNALDGDGMNMCGLEMLSISGKGC